MSKSNCWYSVEIITSQSDEYYAKKPLWSKCYTLQYFDIRKDAVKFAESVSKLGIRVFVFTWSTSQKGSPRRFEVIAKTGNGWNLRGMK